MIVSSEQSDKRRKVALRALAFLLLSLLLASGCQSTNNDRLESELRDRERCLAELRDELHNVECQNEALQRQLHSVHAAPLPPDAPPLERTSATAEVKQIVLGRLTGGYTHDRCLGDDALQVIVEPRDCDGHSIKVSGILKVGALEVTSEGVKRPLTCWELTPEQLRRTWKSGLFGTGYNVVLPWKTWPTTDKLRVVVQLQLLDGRVFEADKDVTLHLPPSEYRKPIPPQPDAPVLPPDPGPAVPESKPVDPKPESAPAPRKQEGPSLSKWFGPKKSEAPRVEPAAAWWDTAKPPPAPLQNAVHILAPQ